MKKEIKFLYASIAFGLLTIIGITYAFFITTIEGNRKNVSVDMSDLKIIFTNGDAIEANDISAEDNFDVVKTFSVENKTKNVYSYNIVIESLLNTFKTSGYLVYKITSNDGGYNMTEFKDVPKSSHYDDIVLASNISIDANVKHNYNIEIKYINSETENQSADSNAVLSGKLYIEKYNSTSRNKSLASVMLEDNPYVENIDDLTSYNDNDTTGTLYQTNKTEDGSTVYLYAGDTSNNWVKFGKYPSDLIVYKGYYSETAYDYDYLEYDSLEECTNASSYNVNCTLYKRTNAGDDIYWRIIRTNEDGSVRLLYTGTKPDTTEAFINENKKFNESNSDPMYAGYMYGTSGSLENNRLNTNDSEVKKVIDNWYEKYMLDYDKYISKSAIYCNDRSIGKGTYVITGEDELYFGAYIRNSGKRFSYKCGSNGDGGLFETTQAIEDKFSASTTGGGNGQLKYPIALMTADEFEFAKINSSKNWFYLNSLSESILNSSQDLWTMSPYYRSKYGTEISGFDSLLILDGDGTNSYNIVRPVLSLSSCVKIKFGDGTYNNPYVIDYDNSCN